MADSKSWTFSLEEGYFIPFEDLQAASPIDRTTTQPGFGLIPREYPGDRDATGGDRRNWTRFRRHVEALNTSSPANVSYKVLYLTRHGFGFHNKKEKEVGTPEWDRYWSLLDGAGGETWYDAVLTPDGVQQAEELSRLWVQAVLQDGVPFPETVYTSPLTRCLQTCHLSLSPLFASRGVLPFQPTIREKLRERMTMHTCDKRRTRSWIQKEWPNCHIGHDMTEEDILGRLGRPESDQEHKARKQMELQELFEMDQGKFLSLTTHSGAITAIFMACGAAPPKVREGTTLAVLVRGEKTL